MLIRRLLTTVACLLGGVLIATGVAAAAGLGGLTVTPFGAADGSISRCNNGNVVIDQVRTAYVSSPNPRYELRSVRFATVPSGCAGLKYTMKVLDYTSPYTELATLSGTMPVSGTTVSWASNDGANLNSINSVNSQITITLVVHA